MKNSFIIDLNKIFTNPTLLSRNKEKYSIVKYFILIQLILLILNLVLAAICYGFNISLSSSVVELSFIYIVVFAPIIEEFSFRAMLKKSSLNIALSLGASSSFLISIFFTDFFTIYIISFLIFILIYFYLKKSNYLFINQEYNKSQSLLLVYSSSFLFGFAHLLSYIFTLETMIPLFFIVIIPKIISGFLHAMFRLKFGLIHSIFLHFSINLMGYIIYYLNH